MSNSETESEPEPELATGTVSNLATFARLSATRPGEDPAGTVSWAVDTLATLDFRLIRRDDTLHGLVRKCASTILDLFDTVLQQRSETDDSCSVIPEITSIFKPSFLHLLFQYRRLFHVIAARDLKQDSAPLAVVCWVDVILAKLGDVATYVAGGLHRDHPDQSLPESLKAQREEDNLRAAIQLPNNWDMLPAMLVSEHVSSATKRLSIRLMVARYILYPGLSSRQVGTTHDNIHALLSVFSEFVRQSAARLDELRLALGQGPRYLLQQERLTSAMAISLFAAADMAQHSESSLREAPFRPHTVAAAMQLLRFILHDGGSPTQTSMLSPLNRLDFPTRIIIQWEIVPQWTWSIWMDYRSLHADTIVCLTAAYFQYHPGKFSDVPELISARNGPADRGAVISVMIDLISRFISTLSVSGRSKQLSSDVASVLQGSCRLISGWMNQNSCGIQSSAECCEILITLFGRLSLSWNERHLAVNALVIECLAFVSEQCACEAWEAAVKDNKFGFPEVVHQSVAQMKTTKEPWDDLPESWEIYVGQLMQFLIVMMSKGVRPSGQDTLTEFTDTVKEWILEMRVKGRGTLCGTLLTYLATAKLSGIDTSLSKAGASTNEEEMWRLGMCGGDTSLFLAAGFSLYIASAPVSVELLTYLEGVEHLLDIALLICSRQYPWEDEPLGLIVLPTICDALVHLLGNKNDATDAYIRVNTRMSALGSVLRSLGETKELTDDVYRATLRRRLAHNVLLETYPWLAAGKGKRAYEVVVDRSHVLYVRVA